MAGLYLHIPFCERKCIYCNFYSIESFDNKSRFLDALLLEIDLRADALAAEPTAPQEYETVFFGGGTPSLLSPEELEKIMTALRRHFVFSPNAEITMECNPGALTPDWLVGYRDQGVNRLSFGVQSFHDDDLVFLSRIHTADQARENIGLVRSIFQNVSLDLIFALPNQTLERWNTNLAEAVKLGTDHISAYSLIFEEGTPLNTMRLKGEVAPISDTLDADMYEKSVEFLGEHGLRQYEVSNYAKPGRECRHNLAYWERRSYTSFGPSAHSFLRNSGQGGVRWANVSSLNAYLEALAHQKLPVTSTESLSSQMILEEIVMLGLRSSGINLGEFHRAAGVDVTEVASAETEQMISGGYAQIAKGLLTLTPRGYIFADRFALQIIDRVERSIPELSGT